MLAGEMPCTTLPGLAAGRSWGPGDQRQEVGPEMPFATPGSDRAESKDTSRMRFGMEEGQRGKRGPCRLTTAPAHHEGTGPDSSLVTQGPPQDAPRWALPQDC